MTEYDMKMALRAPVAKALKKYVCRVCGWFKSEHGLGCPESGRLTSFKPGGYVDLPEEVWDVILAEKKPVLESNGQDKQARPGKARPGEDVQGAERPRKAVRARGHVRAAHRQGRREGR